MKEKWNGSKETKGRRNGSKETKEGWKGSKETKGMKRKKGKVNKEQNVISKIKIK